jgi:hypothetical protein
MTYWALRNAKPVVKDEFGAGHNDDCGPNSEENAIANLQNRDPTYAEMDAIRTRDIKTNGPDGKPLFKAGGGNRIDQIALDATTFFKVHVELHDYHEWYSAQDLRDLLEKYHNVAGTIGICQAYKIPFNEPGVECHYICWLGYDSAPVRKNTKGVVTATGKVLIGNGDREPHGGPDWMWIEDVAACEMYGFIVYFAGEPTVTLQAADPTVAKYFKVNADGSWQHGSFQIKGGILNAYRNAAGYQYAGLTDWGLPTTSEIAVGKPKAGSTRQPTVQVFERLGKAYDPDHVLDMPPGAGEIYTIHLSHPLIAQALGLVVPTPPPVVVPPPPPVPPVDVSAEWTAASAAVSAADDAIAKVDSTLFALKTKLGGQVHA